MPKVFTPEELKQFFAGQKKHTGYDETNKQYKKLYQHANGEIPGELITERRPRESNEIKDYRKKIYVAKTKHPIYKVVNSLSKIRRSPDWSIKYDDAFNPANVIEEESLQAYCEENYPGFKSVTNWMFSIALKNMCTDANAVIAVFPVNSNIKDNEFYKPVAMLFNSPEVIFFEETENYAILLSKEKNAIKTDASTFFYGNIYYVITEAEFTKYEQQLNGEYNVTQYIVHNLGVLPVFKVPAVFLQQLDNVVIQESRLSPMVPHLDEAAREYSDLQAAKVQHMHPLFWYYDNKECNHCGGTGKVVNQNNPMEGQKQCNVCEGKGKVKFSPYTIMAVDPPKMGDMGVQVPIPPAGYIARDVEILKLQEESVDKNLFGSLSSINMQFLDQTPLNISGEAKSVDREELNNFVYSVADDIVSCMDNIYSLICLWRYSFAVPDKKKRKEMLPKIAVPEQFDLLPSDYLMDEISKASQAKGISPMVLFSLQKEYAVKKFYNNPEVAEFMSVVFDLDPLPGLADDEKMLRLSNKGVSQEDYVISCNLVAFVKRAIQEDKTFMKKPHDQQLQVMDKYAQEKIKTITGETQAKMEMEQKMNGNQDPNGDPKQQGN